MGFSIKRAVAILQEETAFQRLPKPITVGEYTGMVLKAIKRLYTDTGRALIYDSANYHSDEEDNEWLVYNEDLAIDEEEYVLLCAQINFFKRVQADANNLVSYSTDAMKVTGADKPYANIRNTLEELEKRRRELYYRMPRYTMDYEIAD